MKKEVFSPSWIDQLWEYTCNGDLANSVIGLAMEMRERYIEKKASEIDTWYRKEGYMTESMAHLLYDMRDFMLKRADYLYSNADDIRAAFEDVETKEHA